ncbi:hypothetical protein PT974_05735 [Cladobotryum mycophilum]|uniref:Uncharacterized protein n=1 Tax=Cladobotryum mycophilum TaxID=491253 RepID=A0ABR0SJL6_9HYPO
MVAFSLILTLAGLAYAQDLVGFELPPAARDDVLFPGVGSSLRITKALAGSCDLSQDTCDNKCIPLAGTCCNIGNGSFCDAGFTCTKTGCCRTGATCNDDSGTGSLTCSTGKTLCGKICIPSTATCCDKSAGTWCSSGLTCGVGGKCTAGNQDLRHRMHPLSAVCCSNGFYCDAGEACTSDNKCKRLCKRRRGGHGGGRGSDCVSAGSLTTPNGLLAGLLMAAPLIL